MDRLPTRVNRADPDFAERKAHNLALIDELRVRLDTASQGGGWWQGGGAAHGLVS